MPLTSTPTVAAFIASRGHPLPVSRGEPLFFEGDRSHSVYVCIDGRIRVFVTLPSGRELLMGFKEPGEAFGELSAIDHQPRAASAVAVIDSVVHTMPGDRFLDELEHEPHLALAVLRNLTDQLRRGNARLRARNAENALSRAGHMLLELSLLKLRHDRRAGRIELPITQADVADWIGTTRESAARALALFRKAGAIETRRGRIIVSDVATLVAITESA